MLPSYTHKVFVISLTHYPLPTLCVFGAWRLVEMGYSVREHYDDSSADDSSENTVDGSKKLVLKNV